jgi:hypothetical protein
LEDKEELKEMLSEPIDAGSIATAKYKIQQRHPLAKTSLRMAFPCLCCCWPDDKHEDDSDIVEKEV